MKRFLVEDFLGKDCLSDIRVCTIADVVVADAEVCVDSKEGK